MSLSADVFSKYDAQQKIITVTTVQFAVSPCREWLIISFVVGLLLDTESLTQSLKGHRWPSNIGGCELWWNHCHIYFQFSFVNTVMSTSMLGLLYVDVYLCVCAHVNVFHWATMWRWIIDAPKGISGVLVSRLCLSAVWLQQHSASWWSGGQTSGSMTCSVLSKIFECHFNIIIIQWSMYMTGEGNFPFTIYLRTKTSGGIFQLCNWALGDEGPALITVATESEDRQQGHHISIEGVTAVITRGSKSVCVPLTLSRWRVLLKLSAKAVVGKQIILSVFWLVSPFSWHSTKFGNPSFPSLFANPAALCMSEALV